MALRPLLGLAPLLALTLFPLTSSSATETEARTLKDALATELPGALAAYRLWDATNRNGIGNSDAQTSGGLGWGESSFLRNYMLCYTVTHDTYWLDKVIDHFDRMIGNLSPPDKDGYRAWSDLDYSVGIVRAEPVGDVGGLTIEPAVQRLNVRQGGGELVTGHEYRLELTAEGRIRVLDVTDNKELAALAYADPTVISGIPGAKLTVKGPARAGAVFRVVTTAPERIEYQVHDGMVTYPVAQFIEVAYTDSRLPAKYRKKAEQYAALVDKQCFEKWERTWVDLPDGAGLYKFTPNPTQRFPNASLPHNQYLALARTWIVLKDVPGLAHRDRYLDRATKMARYFHANLKPNGNGYVWNYWDPLPSENIPRHIEDQSHGTIDIGFAIEAVQRHVVFTEEDLRRFAATYTEVMWNGSLTDPRFGDVVSTNQGNNRTWSEWIELGGVSDKVCEVALAIYHADGHPPGMAPQLAYLYRQVVGITDQDRQAYAAAAQLVAQAVAQPGLANGGFELAFPGAATPFGWTVATWSPDEGGRGEWVDEAHQGKKAIALIGGAKANVIAMPYRDLPGRAGQTVTVTAYYKTTDAAKPAFSVLGHDQDGKRVQYETFALPPSAEWRQGSWAVKLAEGVAAFNVVLRNNGQGTVFYDDAEVKIR